MDTAIPSKRHDDPSDDTHVSLHRELRPSIFSTEPEHVPEPTSEHFRTDADALPAGASFSPHHHDHDQLAWMTVGATTVTVAGTQWHLRGHHLAWIPAGFLHGMDFPEGGQLLSLYADARLRPDGKRWDRPHLITADPLVLALLQHLQTQPRSIGRRRRTLALLHDLLQSSDPHSDAVTMPLDPRSRRVADGVIADPADARELTDWARELGVSARTLARGFDAIGTSFRQWRVQVRLHAAAGHLERGDSVASAAADVGYTSTSAFVQAFRQRFGRTPGAYARAARHAREE